jgi:hypothetical protein
MAAVTVGLWEVSSLLPAGCTPPLKVALVLTLVASIRPHLDPGGFIYESKTEMLFKRPRNL